MYLLTALDVRFKSLRSATEAEQEEAWRIVKTRVQEFGSASQENGKEDVPAAKRQKVQEVSAFFGDVAGDASEPLESSLEDEIERYRQVPQRALNQDNFLWWAQHAESYPRLSQVSSVSATVWTY